jgi:hypothetical protein
MGKVGGTDQTPQHLPAMWSFIWQHRKGICYWLVLTLIASILWGWLPPMAKLVVVIIIAISVIVTVMHSKQVIDKLPCFSHVIRIRITPKSLAIGIAFVLSVLVIILVGFVYRYDVISIVEPSESLYVSEISNPLPAENETLPYRLLLQFGVKYGSLDPIEITINTNLTKDEGGGIWWDSPLLMSIQGNRTVLGVSNHGMKFGTEPTSIVAFAQISPPTVRIHSVGTPISSQRCLYVYLHSSQSIVVTSVEFCDRHFHVEGNRLIRDY